MSNAQSQVENYVRPERIPERLKRLAPGAVVSHSGLEFECDGYLEDSEWGVFDLTHRVYVHHTYDNFIPLISSKDISILITRFGRLPLFFQVMTARLQRGLYYQSFSVFGILYCHQIVRLKQEGEKTRVNIDWYLVSHWLLKFLHAPFNWRLRKLQLIQYGEDAPLRERRLELRRRGLTFVTDSPDFLNANDLGDHVRLPQQTWPLRAKLPSVGIGETTQVQLGPFELLLRRESDGLLVWPGLCPHEGAKLEAGHLSGDQLSCPWHGRTFRCAKLRPGGDGTLRYLGLAIRWQNDELVAVPEERTASAPRPLQSAV
jgi:hypothetical protein